MLERLRNDVIGEGACVRTPFGLRRVTYADHIASGRALASVEDALRVSVLPLYANTHTEDSATGARTTRLMHDASEYVKRCLGADDTYKIVFAGTGATGAVKRLQEILAVSVPASMRERVLSVLSPDERLVVYVGPYEHHSNDLSWRESLAEVVQVPLGADGGIDLAALERALLDERTAGRPKLGSFSAASNVTGLLTDVRAVATMLHRHGALAAFDYAASAPYVNIDVRPGQADAIDALVLSPHKFLGGPGSPGLLLFRESMYHLRAPTTAGGGTVTYVSPEAQTYIDDVETREDAGTPGILQKMRAALAFRVKERIGAAFIEEREAELVARALARLGSHPNVELLGNLSAPRLAVVSFLIRADGAYLHHRFVVRLLSDLFGIQGRGGCSCAGPYGHALLAIDHTTSCAYRAAVEAGFEGVKPGWSRLSFHYLIDDEEFEFLLSAIEFVADHGPLFLPFYTFDWRSGAWHHVDDPVPDHAFEPDAWDVVQRSQRSRAEDYAHYLGEARALAASLGAGKGPSAARRGEDVPPEVDAALVFFAR